MSLFKFILSLFKSRQSRRSSSDGYEVVVDKGTAPGAVDRIEDDFKEGLEPHFKIIIDTLVQKANEEGLKVGMHKGYRSFYEQKKLYAKGRTKPGKKVTNARPGYSWHNFGLAADIVFQTPKGHWTWSQKHDWQRLGEIGKSLGLKWGGDWQFRDMPHFQVTGVLSLTLARRKYDEGGLKKVWDSI
jgi:peptidoglycan LD-endopeptidase CwlK